MKKLLILLITTSLLFSCSDDGIEDELPPEYPTLKIVNEIGDTNRNIITTVKLLNYTFDQLSIEKGGSQSFILDKGMPGGYDDINVSVKFGRGLETIKLNFEDGKTTTIALKGCSGFEGCDGHYLEYIP